jgi:uncharacterized membrane protein
MIFNWSTIKFIVGVVLWLLIVGAMFVIGWSMSTTHVQLDKCPKTFGVVTSLGTKTIVAGRSGNITGFVFGLTDKKTPYWIYRSNGDYSSLFALIELGKSVVVYHSQKRESNGFYTVYQVESRNGIAYSKSEFESKEKLAGRLLVLPGAILLFGMIIFKIRKRSKHFIQANE